jgi:hypothetical protein
VVFGLAILALRVKGRKEGRKLRKRRKRREGREGRKQKRRKIRLKVMDLGDMAVDQ